ADDRHRQPEPRREMVGKRGLAGPGRAREQRTPPLLQPDSRELVLGPNFGQPFEQRIADRTGKNRFLRLGWLDDLAELRERVVAQGSPLRPHAIAAAFVAPAFVPARTPRVAKGKWIADDRNVLAERLAAELLGLIGVAVRHRRPGRGLFEVRIAARC